MGGGGGGGAKTVTLVARDLTGARGLLVLVCVRVSIFQTHLS